MSYDLICDSYFVLKKTPPYLSFATITYLPPSASLFTLDHLLGVITVAAYLLGVEDLVTVADNSIRGFCVTVPRIRPEWLLSF